MLILKIIFAIVVSHWFVYGYLQTGRDKAIRKAKKEGKSWKEIYNEFYKF